MIFCNYLSVSRNGSIIFVYFRVWNNVNDRTKMSEDATKLSTPEAVRSLTCRARQDVSKTLRNVLLLILGKDEFNENFPF